MTNHTDEMKFTVNREASASVHDSGIVILHTGRGSIYTSNLTGARIWRCLEQRLSLDAIAGEISAAYQIARDIAREHVALFVADLERNMLIAREVQS